MKKRKKSLFLLLIIILPGAIAFAGAAAPGSCFVLERVDPSLLLPPLGQGGKVTGYKYVEGEIVGVEPDACWLVDEIGDKWCFRLRPETRVYINGFPGNPQAMRPVAPGAFYWAGIWARDDEAVAIEAAYYGGELVVESSSPYELRGWSPERQRSFSLKTRKGWTLGDLFPGQMVYVLLDLEGRIRRVQILNTISPAGELPEGVE